MIHSNISLFPYFGNKDNEMLEISQNLPNLDEYDVIVEPYAGSFALSRYLLSVYPDKKYICNDNDEMLIDVFKALQNDESFNELYSFFETFTTRDKEHYDDFKKEKSTRSFLYTHTVYRIRPGLYNVSKNKFNEKDLKRLKYFHDNYKNIIFTCEDASVCINKYIDDKKCFIFMDPPFLLCSSFYSASSSKNLEYFFKILMKIHEYESKLLCVCGDNFLLIPFYEKYNIQIKFETTILYRGHTSNAHKNIYVSNY